MTNDRVPAAALDRILREGLRPRPTARSRLVELWSAVGLANLFLGTVTRILAALSVSVGSVVLIVTAGRSLGLLFALSPLLFLALMGFVEGAERLGPLAELRRTLRYSGPQLAAFRILLFGVAGVGFGAVLSLAITPPAVGFGHALMISSVAVTGAAVGTLALLRRVASRWPALALPLAWTVAWLIPVALADQSWETALAGLPAALGWLLVLGAAVLFGRQLRTLLLGRAFTVRGIAHAAGQ